MHLSNEIVSQKSIFNAENQEIIWTSTKYSRGNIKLPSRKHFHHFAQTTSEKKKLGHILYSVNEADSQVSRPAKSLPQCNGLTFSKKFVKKKIQNW